MLHIRKEGRKVSKRNYKTPPNQFRIAMTQNASMEMEAKGYAKIDKNHTLKEKFSAKRCLETNNKGLFGESYLFEIELI